MNPHTKALPVSLSFLQCFYRISILFTAVSSGKCNEKYPFSNIHLCLSVLLFHFSVSWSSEIQFHMLRLKTWASMQTHIPFRIREFRSCFFVYSGTARDPVLFPSKGLCFLCLESSLFSWMRHPRCLLRRK